MSTKKIYALPVEVTEWKFDGATEIAFNWEYDDGSADLLNLYEKGKQQQWDTTTRIDWKQELFEGNPMGMADEFIPIYGSPFWEKMTDKEKDWLRFNLQCHSICQFMHGEQGALICRRKIVQTVPGHRLQVLRGDAGDGRGPPRRDLLAATSREDRDRLPDQRQPQVAARRRAAPTRAGT